MPAMTTPPQSPEAASTQDSTLESTLTSDAAAGTLMQTRGLLPSGFALIDDHPRPALRAAVQMRRVANTGPAACWQPWRWELDAVVPHENAFGDAPRLLRRDAQTEWWLHPGFAVELFRDDGEGYFLNATTPAPCWFVLWRMDDEASVADEPIARPVVVTLSYHDAGRWLDAGETVEQVAAPADVIAWMSAFAQAHYTPEPRKRKRPESFKRLEDRFGNPVSISTEKATRGGPPQGEGGGQGGGQGSHG